jgi:hypothetical protein
MSVSTALRRQTRLRAATNKQKAPLQQGFSKNINKGLTLISLNHSGRYPLIHGRNARKPVFFYVGVSRSGAVEVSR